MIRSLRPLLLGSVAALIFGACNCGGGGPGTDGGEIVPTHLAFTVQPTTTIAGVSISPAVKVALQDDEGNTATRASGAVTLTLGTNAGSGTLSGTQTAQALNGVATFSNLSLDKVGTGYTLAARSASLGGATSTPFNILAASATQLVFAADASDADAGGVISPPVQVAIEDPFGNVVPSAALEVTISLATNPGSSTLSGTTSVVATGGIATFSELSLDKTGNGYTLLASTSSLPSVTSRPFRIRPGNAAALTFRGQPTSALAGAAISPAVQLEIRDAKGNFIPTASGPVTVALSSNPGAGTLFGTRTVNASGGIASFSDLSVDKAAAGYKLTASATGLTSATSNSFDISPAAPTHLVFLQQPTNAGSLTPISPAVAVVIEDAFGNTTRSTANVTMAIATGPSGAVLGGTTTQTAVAGAATFPDLTVDQQGSYTLSAASGALPAIASSSFSIVHGPPTRVAFTAQPQSARAGAPLSPAVRATVYDAAGNVATTYTGPVTLSLANNPTGTTLLGTLTQSAVAGVATFSDLAISTAGVGYTLVATSGSLTPSTSTAFNITAGPDAKLVFVTQPTTTAAAATLSPPVRVAIYDAYDNPTGSTASVTLALGNNPTGATLSGTTTAAAVAGVATFSNLSIVRAGVGYTLAASSGSLSGASAPFDVVPGAAVKLAFGVQPSTSQAGIALSPTLEVLVEDAYGNTVTGSTAPVTISIRDNPSGGVLNGTVVVNASGGVAAFPDLSIDRAGSGYTLQAASGSLTPATSATFDVLASAAKKLAFSTQPPAAVTAAAPFTVVVEIQDALGNRVTSASGNIFLSIASGPSGAALAGTNPVSASAGVATFSTLSIARAGTGFTLAASSGALTGATSASFDVVPGAASKLAFRVQPADTLSAQTISPAVQVEIQDASGNRTSSAATVALAIGSGPAGAALSGTTSAAAVAGVATFSTLSIAKAGTGYSLAATSGSLAQAASASFSILAGADARLAFTVQPADTAAGQLLSPAVQVELQDANGNRTASAANVTLAIASGPGGAALGGTKTVAAVAGAATFSNLSITQTGTFTLAASSGALAGATSASFQILPGPATHLAYPLQPASAQAGAFIPVQVALEDAYGNVVTPSSAPITLSLGTNPTGATLLGTVTVAASAGMASFSDLRVTVAGAGYALSATSGALPAAPSQSFDIAPAAADHLAFTQQPANVLAASPIAPAVQVTIEDAYGNRVTAAADVVAVGIGNNPSGGILSGTLAKAAVAGVASFSDLAINRSGAAYTLSATSGALTGAASAAFDVLSGPAAKLAFVTQPPASTQAGQLFTVDVAVQDAVGNTVISATNAVALALGSNPSGATLGGTTPVSAVNGIAHFADLNVTVVGTGYSLNASSGTLAPATSAAFAITEGPANKLAFTVQPATAASGASLSPAVQVTVQDAWGNTATASAASITLAIANNPSSGTLGGTATRAATAGVATFNNLSIDKVGTGYTLGASSGALAPATSAAFNITPGAPSKLAFTRQPLDTASTVPFQVDVTIQDAAGNTVTSATNMVTVAIASGPGGTLAGTTALAAVGGVASFPNLSIAKAGTGYTLSAASGALTGATSASFAILPGPDASLSFFAQPSNAVSGATLSPAVQVQILDASGNRTGSTANVTLAVASGPGTLAGTTTAAAASGLATFSALSIARAGTYTLSASSGSLTGATSTSFNITAGSPSKLAFFVQPSNTSSGATITPAVQVEIQDANGNRTTSTATVALAVASGPGTLAGTTSLAAVGGVATFGTLSIARAGNYTLSATSGTLTSATSNSFTIIPGADAKLAFFTQPATTVSGQTISPAVQVEIQDANGNRTASVATVALAISAGPGGTLAGTPTVAAVAGLATFADLSIAKAGTGYALAATSGTLTSATSATFAINPGPDAALSFLVQPTSAAAGVAITPAVQVQILDANGNRTASTATITLAVATGPGTLGGTTTAAAVAGAASFSALSITRAGTYTLGASSGTLAGATSTSFSITAGTAVKVAFFTQPSTTVAGQVITPALQVEVEDQYGNRVTSSTANVTVAINTGPGGTLSGTKIVSAVAGLATFNTLSINKTGTYTLSATGQGGLTGATSASFDITPGADNKLAFFVQPANTTSGQTLTPAVQVEIQDANGNRTTSTANVALSFAANPAGGTLAGTASVAAVGGVASFVDLSIAKAGTGYSFTAASAGLTSATSNTFNITAGPDAALSFVAQPANAIAGATLSTVTVQITDSNGNRTISTASITLAVATGPGTLGGTTTAAAAAGLASFTTLSITRAGTYTLSAASGALTQAASNPFTINPGADNKLAFYVQPTDTAGGQTITPAIQVEVQDANGNRTASTASITLAIGTNPSGGTLSGTPIRAAAAGVASFNDLSINRAGAGYKLSATSGTLTAATSAAFNILTGPSAKLAITQQPAANTVAGSAITVGVTIQDVAGNTVTTAADTVTMSIATNPAGGVLAGTTSAAAVNGVASFTTLSIAKAGSGYTLAAASGTLTGATTAAFNITIGAAAQLVFFTQPVDTVAGATMAAVRVEIDDAAGNRTASIANVTVAIGSGPSGAVLNGTKTVAAVAGLASFTTLSATKAGAYTLLATSGTLASAISVTFNILPAADNKLAFFAQPTNTASGQPFSPAVQVEIQDTYGNRTTSSANVALAFATNPAGGALGGTTAVAAVGGLVTFGDITIAKAGTGYSLRATSGTLTAATSNTFTINPGPDAALSFVAQPSNTVSGGTISPAVTVQITDSNGNRTASTASITLAVASGPGTLSGTTTAAATAGLASFNALSILKAGAYTLSGTSGSLTPATSNSFNINPGPDSKLAFYVQPVDTTGGQAIAPAVQVEIEDANGNRTTSTANITLAIGTNPSGGLLSGTLVKAAAAGVASFGDLSINRSGAGYTLAASSGTLTSATSLAFNILTGAANKLAFTQQPADTTSTTPFRVDVTIQDAVGNTVTTAANTVAVAIATGPVGAVLSGTASLAAVSGVAVFPALSLAKSGPYTLGASSTGLAGATSAGFSINPGPDAKLAFTVQPSNAVSTVTIAPAVQVEVEDASGNKTASTASIALAVASGPPGGTLSGTTAVSAAAGVASFSTLSIAKAGGYTVSAASGTLTSATSLSFTISAGPDAALAFTVQPVNTAAGATLTPAVQVEIDDASGNKTASTASVTLAVATGPGMLSGTTAVAAVNGVSTFSTLSITTAGAYTLSAASGTLAPATSAAFSITPLGATKVGFIVQPVNTRQNTPIAPAPQVALQDTYGNTVPGASKTVTVAIGTNPAGGTLSGTLAQATSSGVAAFANLSINNLGTGYTLSASAPGLGSATSNPFNIIVPSGLVYTDPAPGGKIRLVYNYGQSSANVAVLDLVAAVPLTGYSVGLDLPLDATRVAPDASPMIAGTALPAGSSPAAAITVLPAAGPLAGVLVSGQSQKAAGTGAVTTDTSIPSGTVLYSVRLDTKAGATTGVVFDGAALGPKFRGGMRDKLGNDVAVTSDFVIGRLDLMP